MPEVFALITKTYNWAYYKCPKHRIELRKQNWEADQFTQEYFASKFSWLPPRVGRIREKIELIYEPGYEPYDPMPLLGDLIPIMDTMGKPCISALLIAVRATYAGRHIFDGIKRRDCIDWRKWTDDIEVDE